MPKLWANTIESHRQEVRAAVVRATAKLLAQHGLKGVSMSAIALDAGIGRATLYKYFTDLDEILAAWHEDQVAEHVDELRAVADQPGSAQERLARVLSTYADIRRHAGGHGGRADLVASLHESPGVHRQIARLRQIVEDLIKQAVEAGDLRRDVPARELAAFALAAVGSVATAASRAAAQRLVGVTLDALSPRAD
ncbi:TetR/AcrR family transcriptional regulator [Nocardioides sp. T2.26MG-1]|uniref:TetR/AcrR family transcriptional regulator n=1 Tax=Nocardioides sp. T2.26MG-1 TaxID=3041166 RepID=UPI0025415D6C|nr:TetR/AcrR family transcriptional regulator [Nocardioides sp. T2.26MG-1]